MVSTHWQSISVLITFGRSDILPSNTSIEIVWPRAGLAICQATRSSIAQLGGALHSIQRVFATLPFATSL